MKISRINVSNFKSLFETGVGCSDINCFVGLSGSGKSNFLQFIDFISHLMKGDIDDWLQSRSWRLNDLAKAGSKSLSSCVFSLSFYTGDNQIGSWRANFDFTQKCCLRETIKIGCHKFRVICENNGRRHYELEVKDDSLTQEYEVVDTDTDTDLVWHKVEMETDCHINMKHQGSALSALCDPNIPKEFYDFRDWVANIKSFDRYYPHPTMLASRKIDGDTGADGGELAAIIQYLDKSGKLTLATLCSQPRKSAQGIEKQETFLVCRG
ncbi:MAG: AAA family ATPase [Thermoguttaceae bacterium]